ncbi:hypothetical protein D3C78_1943170 [compost metagenome]
MAFRFGLGIAEDLRDGEVDVFINRKPGEQAVVLEDDGAFRARFVDLAVFQKHHAC